MFLNPSFFFFFLIHVKKYGSTRTWPDLFAMSIDDPKKPWPNPNTAHMQNQQEPIHYQPMTHCDALDWFWYWFMLCGCVLTPTSGIFSIDLDFINTNKRSQLWLVFFLGSLHPFSSITHKLNWPNPPQNPSISSPISLSYTHNGTYSELERCKWKFTQKCNNHFKINNRN